MIDRREGKARVDTFQAAGMAEYSDWNDRCDQIADMGGAENKAFMRAITAIPGGHKIVADLAENPVEAARILALPDIEMTIALVGMRQRSASEATRTATVAAVSKAPPPIKPITATARAEVNLATMSEADFQKEWNKRTRGK